MAKQGKRNSDEMMSHDFDHEHSQSECCGGGNCGGDDGMYFYQPEDQRARGGKAMLAFSASALFLLMAVFVGMQIWGNPWYKNIRAEFTAAPYSRTVTVEGVGKVTVKPDIARVSLSVASSGKTVAQVTADNNTKMNTIIGQMKSLGIKPEDIQTSAYDLYPQYDYGRTEVTPAGSVSVKPATPRIIGYNLTQTIDVKIRDLTKTDQVLDKGISAGANQVGSLSFELDDASQVKKDARSQAFQKAKEKAQEMANDAGVSLGKVVTFSENTYGGVMPYANFAMKTMSADSSAPAPSIEPGSQDFSVNVSVTYEIN